MIGKLTTREIRAVTGRLKTCATCHKEKPTSDFYLQRRCADGLCPSCRECMIQEKRRYREEVKKRNEGNIHRY